MTGMLRQLGPERTLITSTALFTPSGQRALTSALRTGAHASCHTCSLTNRSLQIAPRKASGASLYRHSLSRCTTQATIDKDNASVLVCGGGGVALLTAKKLRDLGAWVWMLQRTQNRKSEIEGMGAIQVAGDALEPESLARAFDSIEEVDAVISTVGGTSSNPQVDGEGNINIIDAAVKKGVKKFILVTSIGTGDSKDAPPKQVYQVLETVLKEKVKAEDHLKAQSSKMAYTIIRPGGLKSEAATGQGVLTEDVSVCGAIHREDVADLVAQALYSDKANNKVLSAVDSKQLFGEPQLKAFSV